VDTPDVTQPSSLANAAGALVHRAGALATFADGYSRQAFISGILVDEFADRDLGNLTADRRVITPGSDDRYPYENLSNARISALTAISDLEQYNPTPAWRIGEMFALLGYAETFFAEDMCSGVPLGIVTDGTPTYGPALTRSELIQAALAHFDSAAAYATASDSILNLARIGRARVLLDSGDVAAAGTAAALVPVTYTYDVEFGASTLGRNFPYYYSDQKATSVSDREGTNGLPFVSANDPRVPTQNLGPGLSSGDVYSFVPYSSLTAPMRLAGGVEAVLIRAEAALAANNPGEWANLLNSLRQSAITPPMPPLTADSTTTASPTLREDVMFRERAFWLFGTGHRQGDLRRMVRQYNRTPESIFPTGLYQNTGLQYGTAVTFIPSGEQFNPTFSGCIDTNP
jgi:hypothetical protein